MFAGRDGERLNAAYVARVLERARDAAEIPKHGRDRTPPVLPLVPVRRSIGGCSSRDATPNGCARQLGHASLELTLNHYGRWSEAAMQAEAGEATDTL